MEGEAYKDSGRRRKASRVAAIAPISNYASPLRAPRSSAHEPHHARSSLSFPPIIHQPLPPSLSRTALGPILRLRLPALVVRSPALPFALHPRSYCLCVCVARYGTRTKQNTVPTSRPPHRLAHAQVIISQFNGPPPAPIIIIMHHRTSHTPASPSAHVLFASPSRPACAHTPTRSSWTHNCRSARLNHKR